MTLKYISVVSFLFCFLLISFPSDAAPLEKNVPQIGSEVQRLLKDNSDGECYSKVTPIVPLSAQTTPSNWVRVICEADVSPNFLYWLEVRLVHLGVLEGQNIYQDGMRVGLNDRLYRALEVFQLANNLRAAGLTYETVNSLSAVDISDRSKIK